MLVYDVIPRVLASHSCSCFLHAFVYFVGRIKSLLNFYRSFICTYALRNDAIRYTTEVYLAASFAYFFFRPHAYWFVAIYRPPLRYYCDYLFISNNNNNNFIFSIFFYYFISRWNMILIRASVVLNRTQCC